MPGPKISGADVGALEDQISDEARETSPSELVSIQLLPDSFHSVGVSPPNAEARNPDLEHWGG